MQNSQTNQNVRGRKKGSEVKRIQRMTALYSCGHEAEFLRPFPKLGSYVTCVHCPKNNNSSIVLRLRPQYHAVCDTCIRGKYFNQNIKLAKKYSETHSNGNPNHIVTLFYGLEKVEEFKNTTQLKLAI